MNEVQFLIKYEAITDFESKDGSFKIKRGEEISEEKYEGLLSKYQDLFKPLILDKNDHDSKALLIEENRFSEKFDFFNESFPSHIYEDGDIFSYVKNFEVVKRLPLG